MNKTKEMGLWSNTMVLISSDNGPTPVEYGYGQALPFKGYKAALSEGGIRTPAVLVGGYVEAMLQALGTPSTLCQYNEMVHISDWLVHMYITHVRRS